MSTAGTPTLDNPASALHTLLSRYDLEHRLHIDMVYAQLSPTLDDFYAESLQVDFGNPTLAAPTAPTAPTALVAPTTPAANTATVTPIIRLRRTIPGGPVREASGTGAAFPLAVAGALAVAALMGAPNPAAQHAQMQIASGNGALWPRQIGGSQMVTLVLEPGGADVIALLGA